jgi:TPR repeat protein
VAVLLIGLAGSVVVAQETVSQDPVRQAPPKGERVVYSMKAALPIYQEKARQGDVEAQLMMGQIYAMGDIVDADMPQAFSWFMKAAAQGNAEAQFKVAEMYLYGQGTNRDFSHAEKWARAAATQGYADGQYLLGLMYAEGKGMPEDWETATTWLCKSATSGSQKAIDLLNTRTLTGEITSSRDGEGIQEWCNCSAGRLTGC